MKREPADMPLALFFQDFFQKKHFFPLHIKKKSYLCPIYSIISVTDFDLFT